MKPSPVRPSIGPQFCDRPPDSIPPNDLGRRAAARGDRAHRGRRRRLTRTADRPWAVRHRNGLLAICATVRAAPDGRFARTPGDPAPLVGATRTLLGRIDANVPIADAGTGVVMGGADNLSLRIVGGLAGLLGLVAISLALVGLYGVLSHVVSARTREMGIRLTLGAQPRQLTWMVVRDGLEPVVVGLTVGIVIGLLLRRGLTPLFANLLPAMEAQPVGRWRCFSCWPRWCRRICPRSAPPVSIPTRHSGTCRPD